MCSEVGGEGKEGEGGGGDEGFTDARGVEEFVQDITRGQQFEIVMRDFSRSLQTQTCFLEHWVDGFSMRDGRAGFGHAALDEG